LDIYKKKHPEKEFIIEKKKYNSPSDMIDKLDEMGEKLEVKENKTMETNKVKNFAHAVTDAKEKGLKEFKLNGETHNVDESWKQLEEEEFGDGRDEIDMDDNGKINAKDFEMLRNKKEGKSQKMEESEDLTSINELKTFDGHPVTSEYNGKTIIWDDYEVMERNLDGGGHNDEIILMGSDEDGNEYETTGSTTDGEIDDWDDNNIEMVNSVKDNRMNKEDNSTSSEYDSFSTSTDKMNENKDMCSECGGGMNEEGTTCNECGKMMYESKKRTLRLTESEMIKMISRMVSESVPGIDVTKRAQKASKKENNDYMKEVEGKLKKYSSFDGADNPEFPKQNGKGEKMAINATPEQDEYFDDNRGGTLADLDYDQEPSEGFKKRLKMALEGDPKMGNSQDAANVIKTDTGKNIDKTSKKKKEIEKDAKEVSWGHSWKSPEDVVIVKESKTSMSSVLNEEIERMKKMYKYDEKTQ